MPFLRMLIPVILGIFLYNAVGLRSIWSIVPIFFLLPTYIYFLISRLDFQYQWIYGFLLQLMVLCLGYTVASIEDSLKNHDHYSNFIQDDPIDGYGLIVDLKERANRYEAVVCVHQIHRDALIPVSGKLNLYVPYEDSLSLSIGQHISFNAQIEPHPEPRNPFVFDYGNYLSRKRIHFQSSGVTAINVISECQSPKYWLIRHRASILKSFHRHIDSHTNYSIAASIILGYRDNVDYETKRAFAETGSIHILAVSGMHVGIIFAIAGLLIQRLNNRRKWYKYLRMALYLIVIWGFVLLAGIPASAFRAAWLFTFILFAELVQGSHNLFHRLAIAAFVMLIIDPNYLFDVGFQLSFTAVLGIAAFLPLWNKVYDSEGKGFFSKIWDGVGLSIGATLGTLPLTIYYFNYFPISGLFSSIVVVFFAGIILYVGVAFLLSYWLSLLFPWMDNILSLIGKVLDLVISLLVNVVEFFHALPFGLIENIFLSAIGVACLYLIVVSLRMLLSGSRKKVFLYGLIIPLMIFSLSSFVFDYKNAKTKQIAFYHDYKNNAIELFNGKSSVLIADEPLDDRKAAFLNKGLQIQNQVESTTYIYTKAAYKNVDILYNDGRLKYGDTKVLIVDDKFDLTGIEKVRWDYVLLIDNVEISIVDIQNKIEFEHIIIGSSNWQSRVDQWIKKCEDLDLKYYNIKNKKALVIDV